MTPHDDSPTPAWDDYVEASALTRSTAREFGERIRDFVHPDPPRQPFAQALPEARLPLRTDRLQRLFRDRRSIRQFGASEVTTRDLGVIFSAVSAVAERRTYASAGGLYPVHTLAFVLRGEQPWHRTSVRYEASTHALGVLERDVDVRAVESACNLETGIHPQVILVFVISAEDAVRKYGERAGRFALIEVGHMAQNVGLRLARSKMRGYELGGVQERDVKRLLGIEATTGVVAHAYACGK